MSDNKIPRIEEFLKPEYSLMKYGYVKTDNDLIKEFTEMHVDSALRAAVLNVDFNFKGQPCTGVDANTILTAYPLTNIK